MVRSALLRTSAHLGQVWCSECTRSALNWHTLHQHIPKELEENIPTVWASFEFLGTVCQSRHFYSPTQLDVLRKRPDGWKIKVNPQHWQVSMSALRNIFNLVCHCSGMYRWSWKSQEIENVSTIRIKSRASWSILTPLSLGSFEERSRGVKIYQF